MNVSEVPATESPAEEYENDPVPMEARRSLLSVSAVWAGFPMCLGNAVFGGLIVYNQGFAKGFSAILLGNLLLFGYVGTLSWIAGGSGRNFALQAQAAFGRRGRAVVVGFLATVVIGWFSYQIGLTGTTLHDVFGWNPLWGAGLGAVLYVAITALGIRALSVIGLIGTPLFLVMAGVALYFGLARGDISLSQSLSYSGGGSALGFWACVSIVIGGFADSGTMTADFTRWARDGRSGLLAAAAAFPIANTIAFLIGGLVVAIGGANDPANNGGAFLGLLTGHGPLLTALAAIFVLANLGSVAAHCLYNGAVGWSGLTPLRMRTLAVLLGTVGAIIALTGIWSHIVNWLVLLGVIVPPIGAVLIMGQVFAKRAAPLVIAGVQPIAFAAWAIGALTAGIAHYQLPGSVDAVVGFAVAVTVHTGLTLARTAQAKPAVTVPEIATA
ncbi:cytosine permease [Nocardia sp. SYP-A9097]|uniref:purine-cytosine permease family protein n=1 Tax=Nocardia sp. SYP-A9097 TaxID=2663237 RepID=UPI00129BBA89|nr:cytosine permease [Nocardia sp. SYP-A9097]MRH90789.1 cytosine permease [Nocardia sp. SYP-A9097]